MLQMSLSRFFVLAANTSLIILFGSCFILAEVVNNGKIAFVSQRDGNSELYVMNADGSGQTRLTNNADRDDYPTWSPDGRRIAFIRQNALGWSINLMNADGTNQVQLTTILFTTIQTFPRERFGMAWSPDGTKIVFQDSTDIFTIGVDGNNRVNLTNGQFINFEPSWSPDGSKIAFARTIFDHGYYPDIYTMNPQGGEIVVILRTTSYGESRYPDWSPNGDGLLIGTSAEPLDDATPATISSSGLNLQFLFFDEEYIRYFAHRPRWSPDGTKIVLFSSEEGFTQIWVRDLASRTLNKLTNTPANNFNPHWQPLATSVTVSGRVVTPTGSPLRNARVDIIDSQGTRRSATTGSFGLFTFDNASNGAVYTVSVSSKRYRFTARTIQLAGDLTLPDFIGLE